MPGGKHRWRSVQEGNDSSPRRGYSIICRHMSNPNRLYSVWCNVSILLERGRSAVECRTRNQVSPGSNPPLLPFRRLGIFVRSIGAPADSAVQMSTWL